MGTRDPGAALRGQPGHPTPGAHSQLRPCRPHGRRSGPGAAEPGRGSGQETRKSHWGHSPNTAGPAPPMAGPSPTCSAHPIALADFRGGSGPLCPQRDEVRPPLSPRQGGSGPRCPWGRVGRVPSVPGGVRSPLSPGGWVRPPLSPGQGGLGPLCPWGGSGPLYPRVGSSPQGDGSGPAVPVACRRGPLDVPARLNVSMP